MFAQNPLDCQLQIYNPFEEIEELVPLHDEYEIIKTLINSVGAKLNNEVEVVQESINSVKDQLMSVVKVLQLIGVREPPTQNKPSFK